MLQDILGLTAGNLITHLRKREDADYVQTQKTGNGASSLTAVTLIRPGRTALNTYTATLRDLLAGLRRPTHASTSSRSSALSR